MDGPALYIDFETRSVADLTKVGLDNYAHHPTTQIICLAYAFGDDEPAVLDLRQDRRLPKTIMRHVKMHGGIIAHTAPFEISIWNALLGPINDAILMDSQCICTMAAALAMALPGSLEMAGAALGIAQQKDLAGRALMLKMCKPWRRHADSIEWWEPPEDVARLMEYCTQDVRAEREIHRRVMPLSLAEREVWLLDREINNRGIYVDLATVRSANALVEAQHAKYNAELFQITEGAVETSNALMALRDWLATRGVETATLDKAAVAALLSDPTLKWEERRALTIRQESAKSSTAKLGAFLALTSADHRLRNTTQYHGASTGRAAGRGVQVHNFPRPELEQDEIEYAIELIQHDNAVLLDMLHGSVANTIASCLRAMMIARPGRMLFGGDFASIEARGLAWEAGQEDVLALFRAGADIYCHESTSIYGRPITKADGLERQVGKVTTLALGYQGGIGAFGTMAKGYNLNLSEVHDTLCGTFTDDEVERAEISYTRYLQMATAPVSRDAGLVADIIKQRWRLKRQIIVRYWYAVEEAAIAAVKKPGVKFWAGPEGRAVTFLVRGSFLWCRLPSGRALCYPYPVLEETELGREALTYKTVNSVTKKWERTNTYGGKLVENITQAICRDILMHSMGTLADAGEEIVLHVHDEIVTEGDYTALDVPRLEDLMAQAPAWAKDFPIAVEGWIGKRYRK